MGEDWIRKTERSYKRSVQKAIENRLLPKPLFIPKEQESASYPCSVNAGHVVPARGTKLMLHQGDAGKLALVHQHRILGRVEGDAEQDLKTIFGNNPDLCGIVEVEVVHADPKTRHCEFSIVSKKSKAARRAG